MNSIYNFKNDESGAVTVDWVVLTAAIVGIGLSVIAAISGGVKSASDEIDCGVSVASNFNFSFTKSENKTMEDYVADVNCGSQLAISEETGLTQGDMNVLGAAYNAAAADSPEGYNFEGKVDPNSGYPIYESIEDGSGENPTVIVGSEMYDAETYYAENPQPEFPDDLI